MNVKRTPSRSLLVGLVCAALALACWGCARDVGPDDEPQAKAPPQADAQPPAEEEPEVGEGEQLVVDEAPATASVVAEEEKPGIIDTPESVDVAAPFQPQLEPSEVAPPDDPEQTALRDAAKAMARRLASAMSKGRKADENVAKTQIRLLKTPLEIYHLDLGELPTTAQGLEALHEAPADLASADKWDGPYLRDPVPQDPWGNPYQYRTPGTHNADSFDLWSFGPDKTDGTDDDIGNWD